MTRGKLGARKTHTQRKHLSGEVSGLGRAEGKPKGTIYKREDGRGVKDKRKERRTP